MTIFLIIKYANLPNVVKAVIKNRLLNFLLIGWKNVVKIDSTVFFFDSVLGATCVLPHKVILVATLACEKKIVFVLKSNIAFNSNHTNFLYIFCREM